MPPSPLIEFRNINKKFGEIYAIRGICLDIRRGEIHAIAGENGAGKTTLMNVLFGRLQPDSGSLILRGNPVSFGSPREAVRAGIGMVHQDILSFPQLSVLENIIIGFEPSWPSFGESGSGAYCAGVLRAGPARKVINGIQDSLGFQLEMDLQAKELPFASRQQIELVRMLYRGAEILILDEPTSLLSPDETEKFLDLMKSLRAGGRTILFISHRLLEVFSVADRITVLREGSLAATLDARATDPEGISRLMMGGAEPTQAGIAGPKDDAAPCPSGLPPKAGPSGGLERSATHQPLRRPAGRNPQSSSVSDTPVLELRNLRAGPSGTEPALRDISISIAKGEIFGLGGVVGNGQRSLARVLAGKTRPDSGWVLFHGEEISGLDIKARLGRNIRWLQENQLEEALLPECSLWENFLLGRQREKEFARAGFVRKQKIIRFSKQQIALNNISAPGPIEPLSSLSGGNRQKVALARVLVGSLSLAILEQPCRGLDFRAAGAVHDRLLELSRSRGVSFILISYDFDELLSICNRIAVIYRGEIMGTAESANLSREILGRWAAGLRLSRVQVDDF
jgi:simple sugar transport system ATP-binding protein